MNLTPHFRLSIGSYKVMRFPAGELQVQLTYPFDHENRPLTITGSILSSDNLMELIQLVEALNFAGLSDLKLIMPYCAYSRQDRRCNQGESFSLKIFANIINSLNFSSVITLDNHSDVSTALLDNCKNISVDTVLKAANLPKYDYLISPDAGANKKVQACAKALNTPMLRADKVRDTHTGAITETLIYATAKQLHHATVLIVDDICEGGRTFTELAKAIHDMQFICTIHLYVTHGFFSKGLEELLNNGISHIYTTESVSTESHTNLTKLDIQSLVEGTK